MRDQTITQDLHIVSMVVISEYCDSSARENRVDLDQDPVVQNIVSLTK